MGIDFIGLTETHLNGKSAHFLKNYTGIKGKYSVYASDPVTDTRVGAVNGKGALLLIRQDLALHVQRTTLPFLIS